MEKDQKEGNKINWKALIILVVGAVAYYSYQNSEHGSKSVYSKIYELSPQKEKDFIDIVKSAQAESRQAKNDMQVGGIKNQRDKEICSWFNGDIANGWKGKVVNISSNSDGKGVVGVEVSEDVTLTTWNNSFSDMLDDTLIDQNSELFKVAANLKAGDLVTFSGGFIESAGSCIKEKSLSLDGKVKEPDFIFRFTNIEKL
ncbi:hypothetical protein ACI6PW_23490 [Serratia marcescens]|uniref:hypothetical protein n=1 Tax=Serratia marcescens TaxID=615 RepID=UPI003ED8ABC0